MTIVVVSASFTWDGSAEQLVAAQLALAAAEPAAWAPPGRALSIGACAVCFPRGESGPGREGDPAWAAAAVLRGRHVLADSVVTGAAGAPYEAGLLALREGPLLQAAIEAIDRAIKDEVALPADYASSAPELEEVSSAETGSSNVVDVDFDSA